MEPIKLTALEVEALIEFLKDNINSKTISTQEGAMPRLLLLAFIKLLKAKEQWDEAMKYSE